MLQRAPECEDLTEVTVEMVASDCIKNEVMTYISGWLVRQVQLRVMFEAHQSIG